MRIRKQKHKKVYNKKKMKTIKIVQRQQNLKMKQTSQKKNTIDVGILRKNHQKFMEHSKLISKSEQRFRSKKHNVITGEINKIALSANNDKIIQSINLIETYAYVTSKELVRKKRNQM